MIGASDERARRPPSAPTTARPGDGSTVAPSCPPTPAAGDLRPGPGQHALRRDGQALSRLPLGPGRDLARPRPPGGGRGPRRAGPHPLPRLQPLRQRGRARSGRHPRPPDRRRHEGPGARCSSATRGPRPTSAPSNWPADGPAPAATSWSAPGTPSTAAPSPRCAATGQPDKHEAFRPLPEGFDHVPRRPRRHGAACDPTRVAAVLVEPILGEAGVVAPRRTIWSGCASSAPTGTSC